MCDYKVEKDAVSYDTEDDVDDYNDDDGDYKDDVDDYNDDDDDDDGSSKL